MDNGISVFTDFTNTHTNGIELLSFSDDNDNDLYMEEGNYECTLSEDQKSCTATTTSDVEDMAEDLRHLIVILSEDENQVSKSSFVTSKSK